MSLSVQAPDVVQRLQDIYEVFADNPATEAAARNTSRHSLVAGAGALLGAFVGKYMLLCLTFGLTLESRNCMKDVLCLQC